MATKPPASSSAGDVPATIPNPPGGGSWTWNGTEWVSNDPVAQPAGQTAPAQTEE